MNFKNQAHKLIEDVRKFEQQKQERVGETGTITRKTALLTQTLMSTSSAQSTTMQGERGFKARHGSLQAPYNSRKESIKE